MDACEPIPTPQKDPWGARLQALLEVLLITGIISSYLAFIPFALLGIDHKLLMSDSKFIAPFILLESGLTLMFLIVMQNLHQKRLTDLAGPATNWKKNFLVGLALVPLLLLINVLVSVTIRYLLPKYFSDHNPLLDTIKSPQDLALFILAALLAGGIKEEFQRAFILTRFRDHLGGAPVGLVLWSVIFGAAHYVQGPQGIITASLFGLIFGLVYLAQKSLVAPIVAHGVYDTVVLLGFWFFRNAK